jgi:hypothetical protein
VEEKAARGLPNNPAAGDEQQEGFGEGGEVLDFSVAVEMAVVGRAAGDAHRDVGQQGGH